MKWIDDRKDERGNIHTYFKQAKSIISVALNYYTGVTQKNIKSDYKFSNYAWGMHCKAWWGDKSICISRVCLFQ